MSTNNRITPKEKCKRHYYIRASATLEASIVIPLFVYAVVSVIYMLQILLIKNDVSVAAYNTIRKMSKYAYVYDKADNKSEVFSQVALYSMLIEELGSEYADNAGIVGGNLGISIIGSEILKEENKLELVVSYTVKNPMDIFGCSKTYIKQKFFAGAWLGDEVCGECSEDSEEYEFVYVTEYGEVYHTQEQCPYIHLSVREVDANDIGKVRNLSGSRYSACKDCFCGVSVDEQKKVYITDYGRYYHLKKECSAIKRTIIKIPKKFVTGMSRCGKCSER